MLESKLRVFSDTATDSKGNLCKVLLSDQNGPDSFPDEIKSSVLHQCILWPNSESSFSLRCWTPSGIEIQCCGHGMLASASFFMQHYGLKSCDIEMNGSSISCYIEEGLYWLRFNRVATKTCEIPSWVSQFFSEMPVSAAIAGESDGYIILQWPDEFSLDQLLPPDISIQDYTDRAVIVTSSCTKGLNLYSHLYDSKSFKKIGFRYFAPQYGISEDAATGSALRILADYWYQNDDIKELLAQQQSKEGGLLRSFIRKEGSERVKQVKRLNSTEVLVGGSVYPV